MASQKRIVDNRTFLIGLDELYREAIKHHERTDLLRAARAVAAQLEVPPANVPVEGYYTEDALLTEYFQVMRGLQGLTFIDRSRVAGSADFDRLFDVTVSPIFGTADPSAGFLPTGVDPLARALSASSPSSWSVSSLTVAAQRIATDSDDFSLVGLAAFVGDPVVLAGARESVVLYGFTVLGRALKPREPEYEWHVADGLAERAQQFVSAFNGLFSENLPAPDSSSSAAYWAAADRNWLWGRCVRLGSDDSTSPVQQYHWGLSRGDQGALKVDDFWDAELWTTERYRNHLAPGSGHPLH